MLLQLNSRLPVATAETICERPNVPIQRVLKPKQGTFQPNRYSLLMTVAIFIFAAACGIPP